MQCPKDRAVLLSYSHGAAEFQTCDLCHGMWFSKDQLRHCLQQGIFLPSHRLMVATAKRTKASSMQLNCPQCGNSRLVARQIDGIEIDLCPGCKGIWLDAGELQLILQWHRKRAKATAGTKASTANDIADVLLEGVADADFIGDLAEVIGEAFSKTPELAGEAAAALVEFLGEALSGLFS